MSPSIWVHYRSIKPLRSYKPPSSLVYRQQLRKENLKLRQDRSHLVPQAVHSSCYATKVDPVYEEQGNRSSPAQGGRVGGGSTDTGGNGGRNPVIEASLTAVIGLGMVFIGGVAYVAWYKKNVLDKIEQAFAPGYDPALEVASNTKSYAHKDYSCVDDSERGPEDCAIKQHHRRREQDYIDDIVHGVERGHYYVLLGPKGAGKGTMLFDAMTANQADGVAICDGHPDLEVFRLRLGKALNYEYNEDSQTGLFQRRDPREGGPALDIERALNKLEKVALRTSRKRGKPLVLIINNIHFFKNNDEGANILLQLQQRAEFWAASGILTFIFSSDDSWPFFTLRKTATRMQVISISDLSLKESLHACTQIHSGTHQTNDSLISQAASQAIKTVGGRLSYLSRVARSKDMTRTAEQMVANEKSWLLSQIGLIPDCDDDVMDEQKWSSCSWLLLQEFVRIRNEQEEKWKDMDPEEVREARLSLPSIPYWRCRQIMTRPDFLEELDRVNIISIDVHHDVRPDSMLTLHAAREVVNEEGFQELLDGVRGRVDEIESLHRTRELTFKDLNSGDRLYLTIEKGNSTD